MLQECEIHENRAKVSARYDQYSTDQYATSGATTAWLFLIQPLGGKRKHAGWDFSKN